DEAADADLERKIERIGLHVGSTDGGADGLNVKIERRVRLGADAAVAEELTGQTDGKGIDGGGQLTAARGERPGPGGTKVRRRVSGQHRVGARCRARQRGDVDVETLQLNLVRIQGPARAGKVVLQQREEQIRGVGVALHDGQIETTNPLIKDRVDRHNAAGRAGAGDLIVEDLELAGDTPASGQGEGKRQRGEAEQRAKRRAQVHSGLQGGTAAAPEGAGTGRAAFDLRVGGRQGGVRPAVAARG